MSQSDLFDTDALLGRLSDGAIQIGQEVVLLLGSALSLPTSSSTYGVPSADGVVSLIEKRLSASQRSTLDAELAKATNRYQSAFRFLSGHRGQGAINSVIREAVLQAWTGPNLPDEFTTARQIGPSDADTCKGLEERDDWQLSPALTAVGELATSFPGVFGKTILTTNFDPLIEVAIRRAGGAYYRTSLHREGDIDQTQGTGSHIVHLHGLWYGSDTLHTPRQLSQSRPRLKASLARLINNKTLLVVGYGGWSDVFMSTLVEIINDDQSYPEVLWSFYQPDPDCSSLEARLAPGIDRGRVNFYVDVNCNDVLPALLRRVNDSAPNKGVTSPTNLKEGAPHGIDVEPIAINSIDSREIARRSAAQDTPPIIDVYVGREKDLEAIQARKAQIIYITGIGGQGKSALAAAHFNDVISRQFYDIAFWKDCREEADRFENHIVNIISALEPASLPAASLLSLSADESVELIERLAAGRKMLIVFDNVDHYFDVELRTLTGAVGRFISSVIRRSALIDVVFTCRPQVSDESSSAFSYRLGGLDISATVDLFNLRKAFANPGTIERANRLTQGHAFWLDLLAAQVVYRSPRVELEELLDAFSSDTPELPITTLNSIWDGLREREQSVLRFLAEAVRPTTAERLTEYHGRGFRYHNVVRALRVLREYNLVVQKDVKSGSATFELHPVIKSFIRRTFSRIERQEYIHPILAFYEAFFGIHRPQISQTTAVETLEHWTEGAELRVAAGEFAEAFECLWEVSEPMRKGDSPGEFIRVAKLLLDSIDWRMYASYPHFDKVVSSYVTSRSLFGDAAEARSTTERYHETLEGKNARYINYCDLNAYVAWLRDDFVSAIKWGLEGKTIKDADNIDTAFDTGHNLALAQRDSGAIQPALEYFLAGTPLAEVVKPDTGLSKGAPFYGNVGRCLQLRGQLDQALVCYRKSASRLKDNADGEFYENSAYLRQWVAEAMLQKGDYQRGQRFLRSAEARWALISPVKEGRVANMLADLSPQLPLDTSVEEIERQFETWAMAGA